MIRLVKCCLRILLRLLYGVRVQGLEHYHEAGQRVLIVANHTSLLDGILLYAWLPETPTFAINTRISEQKQFRFFLRFVDLFVMDHTNPLSIKSMIRFIREDRRAVIFPEGRITNTGSLMKIYEGPGLVADRAEAMVLPIAIDGAQYSPFSYLRGRVRIVWFPRITVTVFPPERIDLGPDLSGHARRKAAALAMQRLMFLLYFRTYDYRRSLFGAFLDSCRLHGMSREILEDVNREPLTYRQLLVRVFILARLLRNDTVEGEYVGLLLPNVSAIVTTLLALQSMHRVTAMLNYTAGTQAVISACDTAGIRTVYTSRRFIDQAGLQDLAANLERRLQLIYLEDLRSRVTLADKIAGFLGARFPRRSYGKPGRVHDPDSPAIILFTSGSEGSPKGVVLSHANILSNYAQVRCHINFNASDIMFSCLPMFHSFGLNAGCLMPLLGGSKIFIYPTPLHYRVIPELVYELGATILFGTSTFFKGYAHHAHPYDFQSLRYVVAGAEKLRDDTRLTWMEKFGVRILEGYGVTETSPVISVNTPVVNKPGTVGQALPGMECYLEPVAGIDEGGRLVVSGPNIMLGYLLPGNAGGIQAPIARRGPGWHDTGDIASIDTDGFIRIQGRAKRFAKLGGEMVSLTAVEELALQTWPGFNHAAITLPDEKKGEKIVLVTDNREATRRHMQEQARKLGYGELYIPRKVVMADELPLLSTGKINYLTLTELALAEDRDGSGWVSRLTHLIRKPDTADADNTDENGTADVTSPPAPGPEDDRR